MHDRRQREPIAVVGIGLRFPGGNNSLSQFAGFLRAGRSGITPVPEGRWDVAAFAPADDSEIGKIRTSGGGFLERIDEFDAQFFNISPKEANYVDPQQRLLLETSWQALEHANISPAPWRGGNGGVYVGASSVDYALESNDLEYAELDGHLAAGTTIFPLSGRLSYFLGWCGPCMSIDTACSSALTALHLAVGGLRNGECDIALCAGVNAIHHPRVMVTFSHANMLAPDAQCKTFDDAADGYVRAEGCGVLVLKRLSDAISDGDDVLAVVLGTAVGQDGESAGLTVPNGVAQEATMRKALADACVEPADISYVEAHGTGTALGDPIEMGAINDVFSAGRGKDAPVVVASVKTNLGHMEPASGIVAIVKTVAQMRERVIYPHLNMRKPSGRIPWDSYPVTVPTRCLPWDSPVRRAVVNSFGFAGTIAAAVLEEAPARVPARPPEPDAAGAIFTISAKSKAALGRQLAEYQRFLTEWPDVDVRDLCYTTNVGRNHFAVRAAGAVRDRGELADQLDKQLAAVSKGGRRNARQHRKAGFLFAGQGSQYPGMGAAAYQQYPLFRQLTDECDKLFAPHLGRSIKDIMLGDVPDADVLHQTRYTQPALFTLEYALAGLWMSWGIRPNTMIGHSVGEIAAAAVAGVFSLADAAKLVAARARLMQSVSVPGAMAAVSAPADEVMPLVDGRSRLAVAAINSPRQCVVSGEIGALTEIEAALRDRGLNVTRLAVSHAFHSPLMAEVFGEFRAVLAEIGFRPPTLTLISNVTGDVARPAELTSPDYWVRHIGEPVDFAGGMVTVARRGGHVLIEIGPTSALTALGRQCDHADDHAWVASMSERDAEGNTLRKALASAYTAGLSVSWTGFHQGRAGRKIALPSYAFDRKRYWLPNDGSRHGLAGTAGHHPLLGREVTTEGQRAEDIREFSAELRAGRPGYLADHVIMGRVTLPASACLEMLFALGDAVFGTDRCPISDLRVLESVTLTDDGVTEVRTRLTAGRTAEISVHADGVRRCLATATLSRPSEPAPGDPAAWTVPGSDGEELTVRSGDEMYAELAEHGLDYGPAFRRLRRLTVAAVADPGDCRLAVAELSCRHATPVEHAPPEVTAGALQAAAVATGAGALIPASVRSVRLLRKPRAAELRVLIKTSALEDESASTADLLVCEGDEPVLEISGAVLAPPAADGSGPAPFLHEQRWLKQPSAERAAPRVRHVVLLNRPAREPDLAEAAMDAGVQLSYASGTEQAREILTTRQVTDVWWFWRPGPAAAGVSGLAGECERNYRDLLKLVRLLTEVNFGHNQRLWLITEHGQQVPGDPPGNWAGSAAATLWGFGHVLLNEYPVYRVTMADLDGSSVRLIDDLLAPASSEFQIAYRGTSRLVRRVVASDPSVTATLAIKPDKTYLVTGGLGALGLLSATKLASLGARHLALVSRSSTPAGELAHLMADLRQQAEVTAYQGDIASPADVKRIFAEIAASGRQVAGIVHTAGVLADNPVSAQTWESIDEVFRPKVYGTWLLHEAAAALPDLDFFVGFSSAAAALGGVTQSNYAAANAFMDDLMRRRRDAGLAGLSINWGPWSEVGMSARLSPAIRKAWDDQGIKFFSPARGMRALASLLAAPVAQVGAGECDWSRFVPAKPIANALYDLVFTTSPASRGVDVDTLLALEHGERRQSIEEHILARLAGVLHSDDLDAFEPDVEFVQLGLDSLMAMELRAALEGSFRMPLPASIAFDYPSAELLAEFVDRQLVPEAKEPSR